MPGDGEPYPNMNGCPGGALVISLDFELHWGIRDHVPFDEATAQRMLTARRVVGDLLERFRDREVAATWATVGLLFASRREELEPHQPKLRPRYPPSRAALDPFAEPVGADEASDPSHYALSLIERIRATPRQEIATHTFSHFYCYEDRAGRDAFDADLASAVSAASARGIELRSVVFPRNQVPADYLTLLPRHGLRTYRGNAFLGGSGDNLDPVSKRVHRLVRFADGYLPLSGGQAYPFSRIVQPTGLRNVRASAFLRAHSPGGTRLDGLHMRRLLGGLHAAARRGGVYHLWWHPHNFAGDPEHAFAILDAFLDEFARLRESRGMRSLTMDEAGEMAAAG